MTSNDSFKRLWSKVSPHRRKQLSMLMVLVVLTAFAEIISIGAVLPFLSALTSADKLFNNNLAIPIISYFGFTEPNQLLLPLTILFVFAAIISGLMRFLLLWTQTRLGYALGADLSIEVFRRTLYQPYAVHVARNSSEVIAGISGKVNSVVYNQILPFLVIISGSVMLVSILTALIAIDPLIALSVLSGFGIIYSVIVLSVRKRLKQNSFCISRESNQVIKALQEGLGGIRDVLIDGTQKTYCTIYRNSDIPLRRAQATNQIIANSPRFGIEVLGMVLIAFVAYFLATSSEGAVGAIPILGMLALGAQRLLPVLQQLYGSWSLIHGGYGPLHDTLNLLEQSIPSYASEPRPEPITFEHSIKLKDLSFRHAPEAPMVLQNLSLEIKKGCRIGFIGKTGSGKSTLLDIIMGLLQPSEGKLSIDNVTIDLQNHRAWQAHIAHVPQSIYLADATIAENIAFCVPVEHIDHVRVQEAARKAQIAETIESWAKQYDTKVGERGVRLSGGQRQRIGIARALYKQADVIVFDEATSALDSDTERTVMEAIESIGPEVTILLVAHRLSTLKNCDQIVELDNGTVKIIENDFERISMQEGYESE